MDVSDIHISSGYKVDVVLVYYNSDLLCRERLRKIQPQNFSSAQRCMRVWQVDYLAALVLMRFMMVLSLAGVVFT